MNPLLEIFLIITFYGAIALAGLGVFKFIQIQRNIRYQGKFSKIGCGVLIVSAAILYGLNQLFLYQYQNLI